MNREPWKMAKLIGHRNALLMQVKWELAAAEKLHERKASLGEATDRLQQLAELAKNFRQTQSQVEEDQTDPEAIASVYNFRDEFFTNYELQSERRYRSICGSIERQSGR